MSKSNCIIYTQKWKKMLLSNKNVYRFYLKKNLPSTISFFTFRDFHRCECCSKEVRWPNKYKFLQYIHPSIEILLYSYTSGIDTRIKIQKRIWIKSFFVDFLIKNKPTVVVLFAWMTKVHTLVLVLVTLGVTSVTSDQ